MRLSDIWKPSGPSAYEHAAFEAAPVALAALDLHGRFTRVNAALAALVGYSREELVGKSFEILKHPDDLDVCRPLFELLAVGRVDHFELDKRYLAKDGSTRHVHVKVIAMRGRRGKLTGSLGIAVDATREVELERVLGEASSVNAELEAFNRTVSHDLRAPLRNISAFSDLLERKLDGSAGEAHALLDRIRGSADRAQALVDDMLRLSRAGRAPLSRKPIDVSALASEAYAAVLPGSGGAALFVCQPGGRAVADAGLVRTALENLLSNALKFTRHAAKPRVEFGFAQEDGQTVFHVRDNGAGFDPKRAGRLFEPFETLHDRKVYEGTGIGLATVRRIVERHGGRVWTESTPGKGAAFYFTLPI